MRLTSQSVRLAVAAVPLVLFGCEDSNTNEHADAKLDVGASEQRDAENPKVRPAHNPDQEETVSQELDETIIDFRLWAKETISAAPDYQPLNDCRESLTSRVDPIDDGPERATCVILSLFPHDDGERRGSGFIVSDHLVLTAGHNVYNRRLGGWAKRVTVIPGSSGNLDAPFGRYAGARVHTVRGWFEDSEQPYDYAGVVVRGTDMRDCVGYFLDLTPISKNSPDQLVLRGYPIEVSPPWSMWASGPPVAQRQSEHNLLLRYVLDAAQGNSGGPVVKSQNEGHAVGVHIDGGCPNLGVRITSERKTKILKEWK